MVRPRTRGSALGSVGGPRLGARRAALALLALFALPACKLDTERVEASVRSELGEKGIEVKSVDCPDDRPQQSGDAFECKGETAAGGPFTVKVTQGDGGTVKWTVVGRVFDSEAYSRELGSRLGLQLDCGKSKIIAVKGTKLTCTWAGKSTELVFADDEGNIDADFKKAFQLE